MIGQQIGLLNKSKAKRIHTHDRELSQPPVNCLLDNRKFLRARSTPAASELAVHSGGGRTRVHAFPFGMRAEHRRERGSERGGLGK